MSNLYDLYSVDLVETDVSDMKKSIRSAMYELDENGKDRKVALDRFEFSNLLKLMDNKDYEYNKLMTDNSSSFMRIIINLLKLELKHRGISYTQGGDNSVIISDLSYKVRQIEFNMLVYACMLRYYGDRDVPLNTQPYFNEHRDELIEKAVLGNIDN